MSLEIARLLFVGLARCFGGKEKGVTTCENDVRELLRGVVADVAHHIDAQRWDALQDLYSNTVSTDYTSLFGGSPQVQSRKALIEGWRQVLTGVSTQHLLGPITVELQGVTATARCHVRALHSAAGAPGGSDWEVLGHYVFQLRLETSEWAIAAMTLETLMQMGNSRLLEEVSAARETIDVSTEKTSSS